MKQRRKKLYAIAMTAILLVNLCIISVYAAYSNEYPNTWKNTGNQANDIVGVALSQVGYKETGSNHTKYNAWYYGSDIESEWCAVFVSWCANQAGVSCISKCAVAAPDAGYFNIPSEHYSAATVCSGDIAFIENDGKRDSDGDYGTDHVGIVTEVSENYVYVVEGNSSNSVKRCQYNRSDGEKTAKDYNGEICYIAILGKPAYTTTKAVASGNDIIGQLKKMYPDGKYWNHAPGSPNNEGGYTSTPCTHHHGSCPFDGSCGCNTYTVNGSGMALQCMGYAYTIARIIYGGNPYNEWKENYNTSALNTVKAGDIIRFKLYKSSSYYHSIFVTAVNGDTITFTDCNSDGTCIIRWDRSITKSEILANGFNYVDPAPYELPQILVIFPDIDHSYDSILPYKEYTNTGKTVYTYSTPNLTATNGGEIWTTDYCTITKVYVNGACEVVYPVGNGTRTGYTQLSNFPIPNPIQPDLDHKYDGILPFRTYMIGSTNIYPYTTWKMETQNGGYIDPNDSCTINKVYTNGACEVVYPVSGGTRTAYTKISNFISTSATLVKATATQNITTYIDPQKSDNYNRGINKNESYYKLGTNGNMTQVIYYNSDLGKYQAGWAVTSSLSCSHVKDNGTVTKAATCATAGTKIFRCTKCGATIETQTVAALGHSYGTASYSWNSDHSSCTATRTCNRKECTASESTNGTVSSSTTKAATCTAAGDKTYTATFSKSWASTQTYKASIAALGHSYGTASYSWNSDHSSCTATHKCTRSGCTASESTNGTVSSSTTKAATCTAAGEKTYTATFSKSWASTQTYKASTAALGHSYSWWTKTNDSIHNRKCSICGNEETASHSWNNGVVTTPATETSAGVRTYTCSVCNGTKTESIPVLPPSIRYTIIFDPDNGQPIFTRQTGTAGALPALPEAPVKSGYAFVGWYMGQTKVSVSTVFTSDTTVKAHWTKKETPDSGTVEDFISRMYSVCLDRVPGQEEIAYYTWEIDGNGMTGTELAYRFIFSDEFLMKNYCDRHYAEALYRAFMGREPSAAEIDSKAYLLQQGQTREQIFNEFVTSREYKDICAAAGIAPGQAISFSGKGTRAGGRCTVDGCHSADGMDSFNARLYSVVLDRQPAQNELDAWAYYLIHGDQTAKSAAKSFLFSEEFQAHGYDDAQFVSYLYEAMMGRTPGSDEVDYWVWMLSSQGLTREAAFEQFAASDEFMVICAGYGIVCE